jgi:hypothetical protein
MPSDCKDENESTPSSGTARYTASKVCLPLGFEMLVMTDVHDVAIGHLERRNAWWKPGMISGTGFLAIFSGPQSA